MINNFLKYQFPLYLYAVLIFYVSSIPRPLPRIGIIFFDKIMHVAAYVIFAILAARAFRTSDRRQLSQNFRALAILATVIYGISDEFHQAFVPNRICSMLDVFADGVGGVIGAFVYGRHKAV